VIETTDGGRLPAVPFEEALKPNQLRDEDEGRTPNGSIPVELGTLEDRDGANMKYGFLIIGATTADETRSVIANNLPPARTNPLFPPLPIYGPPSLSRDLQCLAFRVSSFFLSLCFLGVIVLGAFFT